MTVVQEVANRTTMSKMGRTDDTDVALHLPAEASEAGYLAYTLPHLAAAAIVLAVLAAVLWSALVANLEEQKQVEQSRALREVHSIARVYAHHIARLSESFDHVLMDVRRQWQLAQLGTTPESDQLSQLLAQYSSFNLSVTDKEGNVVASTRPSLKPLRAHTATMFAFHLKDRDDKPYVDVGRDNDDEGSQKVEISRKLIDENGDLQGIVLLAVTPQFFMGQFADEELGESGILAVANRRGETLITRLGTKLRSANDGVITRPLPIAGASGTQAITGTSYFSNGRSRFVGWQAAGELPLVVVAASDEARALASYYRSRSEFTEDAIVTTAVLTILAVASVLIYCSLDWRRRQLEALQLTYRMATERGSEGFVIVRPVYCAAGELVDFCILDCNHNGARLIGKTREQLVGTKISSLYQGQNLMETMNLLQEAMATGTYEGELQISNDRQSEALWVHLTIARPNSDLAVTARDITAHKQHLAELERIGNEDALTGLPNRHWLNKHLPHAIDAARRGGRILALLFIDLDGFKQVNDLMGHDSGDELLRNAAKRLQDAVRPEDAAVRIGGDEFVVVIEGVHGASDVAHVAERILDAFRQPFRLQKGVHSVGTSIGVGMFPQDAEDATSLLNCADIAMYAVKTSGKRNYRFFSPEYADEIKDRHRRETELKYALENNQIVVFYQPRVDLSTGRTTSMEALARWAHPTQGILEPREFIPLAEERGLIVQLGEIVIEKVCEQLASWERLGGDVLPVSINVSALHFNGEDLAGKVERALKRHNIHPDLVEIELTESAMMKNVGSVRNSLTLLQEIGIKLLVDDFGTGYSSLSQLQELEFDVLKVDGAFTSRLEKTTEGNILFATIIKMAHSLGMRVVAEGVETIEQARALKALQCDEVQGYLISHPVAPGRQQPFVASTFRF